MTDNSRPLVNSNNLVGGRIPGKVGRQILTILMQAGIVFVNQLYEASRYPRRSRRLRYFSIHRSVNRLQRRGFVTVNGRGVTRQIELTEEGRLYADLLSTLPLKLTKPVRWDRKWRLMVFDIPERHREVRDVLRAKIRELGFVQLQKSVFITPWPCKEIVEQIQKIYRADQYIRYIEAVTFDGEEAFRERFKVR